MCGHRCEYHDCTVSLANGKCGIDWCIGSVILLVVYNWWMNRCSFLGMVLPNISEIWVITVIVLEGFGRHREYGHGRCVNEVLTVVMVLSFSMLMCN